MSKGLGAIEFGLASCGVLVAGFREDASETRQLSALLSVDANGATWCF